MNMRRIVVYATNALIILSLFSILWIELKPSTAMDASYNNTNNDIIEEFQVIEPSLPANEEINIQEEELFPEGEQEKKNRSGIVKKGKVVYLTKLPKCGIPFTIYKIEKDLDLFENMQCPPATFKTISYDLNADGQNEFIISNPDNNSQFWYFWRIYQYQKGNFKPIGEMACNAIRTTPNYTDGYQDLECYGYISMVEGELKLYRHFGNEYILDSRKKIESKEFHP